MNHPHDPTGNLGDFRLPSLAKWKRLAIVWGIIVVAGLIAFAMTWNAFFKYVPPGKHLIIINKDGGELDEGEVLAKEGQKGIQRDVKGEGWHFVLPIVYTTELDDNTEIPPGKVGIVTSLGGRRLPPGKELADEGEQGIRRAVLTPGTYRINKKGYQVELVDAVEIQPGDVGVLQRRMGNAQAKTRFATENSDEKGILEVALQPGIYYINTREYDVTRAEVGIFQTTFHLPKEKGAEKDTSISFVCRGGFPISIDCTVEWEVLPELVPHVIAEYGSRKAVEQKVIEVQAHAICRDKGIDYGVQDFLEGTTREKFQDDFTQELTRVCKDKNVTVHSAFIRRIEIPEEYLKPIREKQIAAEIQLTNRAKEVTAQSENEVEREERMVEQEVARVEAETRVLVGNLDQEVANVAVKTEAEVEKIKADYTNQIAALDSRRRRVVAEAEAEATKLKETAKGNIYQLKMEVFQNDPQALLKYTLADQLNPNMVLRFFQAGPGTLWTNMDSKSFNLMLPAPAGSSPRERAARTGNNESATSPGGTEASASLLSPMRPTAADGRASPVTPLTKPAGSK
jgi:hypothetical protein